MISKYKNKNIWLFAVCTTFIIFMASSAAYANSSGRIQSSGEVTKMFEAYQVFPDHNYYYSGSAGSPRGIIGIHKDYTLDSRLWKPVDLTPEKLKGWINSILSNETALLKNNGASILDSNGNRVGVWYSPWETTSVKIGSDNRIVVNTPTEKTGLPFGLDPDD